MKKIQKKVVVLGKGKLAIKIARWFLRHKQYKLVAIVPVIPEPTWTTSLKDFAISQNIPIIDSGHYMDLVNRNDELFDIAVSVTYDKIIKEKFIKKCKKIINIHNGPLPKYRGVSPINWALKNNEKKHGVTIHEITVGIDDGPIISQVLFSIYPQVDEVIDVYERCLEFGWVLFQQTMRVLDQVKPVEQDHSVATYYNTKQNNQLGERRYFTKKDLKS